jgi:RNA polymerase sigma-70 factor, ECF subfamily
MRSKNFKGKSKFSTWFHRIVLNECNRVLKHKQRRAEVPLDDVAEDSFGRNSPAGGEILIQQVAGLAGSKDGRILELVMQGYSSREIATKLHMSSTVVRKRWERARKKLQPEIAG